MRRGAQFQQLAARLRQECLTRHLDVSDEAIGDVLARQVQILAQAMRVQQATILRTYADQINISLLADQMAEAAQRREQEVAGTPHAILPLGDVGRLVASLGQVVRCVSLNHDELIHERARTKWDAIGVLDAAGDGLTLIGESLETAMMAGNQSTVLSDQAIVFARTALTRTVANLRAGRWSYHSDHDVDTGVTGRMEQDLALLPPG
jgi:hypothetical protein